MEKRQYTKVYDFTNENVNCLQYLYNFDNSKVLSVIGSGDQYFTSILNGAKKVDVFDINSTAYLYLLLKFYSIRELNYEEFYDLFINKNFDNIFIYKKLESVLPLEVLKYYKYLVKNKQSIIKKKKYENCFKNDGIHLLLKQNQKYYFNKQRPIIPFLIKDNYYKLQEKIKNTEIPDFYNINLLDLKSVNNNNYDILLTSNIYSYLGMTLREYTNFLNEFNIPEIQAFYDWYGDKSSIFDFYKYEITKVLSSSTYEYGRKTNFVYSLKK